MSSYDPPTGPAPGPPAPLQPDAPQPLAQEPPAQDSNRFRPQVGTVVWGLVVLSLAVLIIITGLDLVALDGTYVLIGLMTGAGAALVIGGLLARGRDKEPTKGKS